MGAHLPAVALTRIFELTGDIPQRFAGVCKSWRWILDDPRFRTELTLVSSAMMPRTTVMSFSKFVCSRPAATEDMTIALHPMAIPGSAVVAALTAVIMHVAPGLRALTFEPSTICDAVCSTPFFDQTKRLEYLRTSLVHDVDLRHTDLGSVDVSLVDPRGLEFSLPESVLTCRFRAYVQSSPRSLACMLNMLPTFHRLATLAMYTEHECVLHLDMLPPSIHTIRVDGLAYTEIRCGHALLPNLCVLGLKYVKITRDLADLIVRCPMLTALGLVEYWLTDGAYVSLDASTIPLKAVHLVSHGASRVMLSLPRGIRRLTLGAADMLTMWQLTTSSLEVLCLDLEAGISEAELDKRWPETLSFPKLHTVIAGCRDAGVAARLGQKCGLHRRLLVLPSALYDIETDYELL
jgi:hypothetical protein